MAEITQTTSLDDKKYGTEESSVPVADYHPQGREESGDSELPIPELEQEQGVSRIEALYSIFGYGWKLWTLYIALGLLCYATSLESNTTYLYQIFAVSSFSAHPLLATIGILTSILGGVIQPFIAKIADLFSRPTALCGGTALLVLGYIVIASSTGIKAFAAGSVISTIGGTAISVVFTILLGDMSPLQWRGFLQGWASSPYIINAFVSSNIANAINGNEGENWRWGYGMFCVIIPVCVVPILIMLFWAGRTAKRIGAISIAASDMKIKEQAARADATKSVWLWTQFYWKRIDGFGLILMGFGFSLILLPFSLAAGADGGYKNASLIAMFAVGGIVMISFFVWEFRYASFPLMPRRVMNRTMICCCFIDFLYYLSFYIGGYFNSMVYIITDWSYVNYNYWTQTLGVGLCGFGIIVGIVMRLTHRYKNIQLAGLGFRIIGMGLQFLACNGNHNTATLVMAPVLNGLGGACSVIGSQVAVQAAVPHRDMGTAIALLALWTSVGGGIGNAIGGAIWNHNLPKQLEIQVGDLYNATELSNIFLDLTAAKLAEPKDKIRQAYLDANRTPMLIALIFTILPLAAGLMTSNFYLGNTHNSIENKEVEIKKQSEIDEALALRDGKV